MSIPALWPASTARFTPPRGGRSPANWRGSVYVLKPDVSQSAPGRFPFMSDLLSVLLVHTLDRCCQLGEHVTLPAEKLCQSIREKAVVVDADAATPI